MAETLTPKKLLTTVLICLLLLAAVMIVCTSVGPQKISFVKVFKNASTTPGENIDYEIFITRLRRIIIAALIGSALAGSGVILQALLRNPLADPYILGISSGAALGAIIAILSGVTFTLWAGSPIALFSFCGSILTIILVWLIGRFGGKSSITSLLLAGVVVNAFLSALIMFLISIAKSDQLRTTIFWLMGNLTDKSWAVISIGSLSIIGGLILLFALCHKLNAMTLGDFEAQALGVCSVKIRALALALSAFITAVAVSLSGLIGFVGLIVPHSARLIFGPDHRLLLPVSAITGAAFLVIADTIARSMFGQEQLPVGIITAITGGPFFLVLLAKYSRRVSWLK
jgi:iron complex transport system permease protein